MDASTFFFQTLSFFAHHLAKMLLWLIQEVLDALEVGHPKHGVAGGAAVLCVENRCAAQGRTHLTFTSSRILVARPELSGKNTKQLRHVSGHVTSVREGLRRNETGNNCREDQLRI